MNAHGHIGLFLGFLRIVMACLSSQSKKNLELINLIISLRLEGESTSRISFHDYMASWLYFWHLCIKVYEREEGWSVVKDLAGIS